MGRASFIAALLIALSAAAGTGPRPAKVAVLQYQRVGVAPARAASLIASLREAIQRRGFELTPADPAQDAAAARCGEDPQCLADAARPARPDWVLALGMGQVGRSVMLNALLIDPTESERRATSSRQLAPDAPIDAATAEVARDLLAEVPTLIAPPDAGTSLAERPEAPPADAPTKPDLAPPEQPPPLLAPERETRAGVRPAVWIAGGAAVLATAASVALGLSAQRHHESLPGVPLTERPAADQHQRTLNLGADAAAGVAVAAGVATLVLWLTTPGEGDAR